MAIACITSVRNAVHGPRLDARIDSIVDIIHDDKILERQGDLSGEPVQFADGGNRLGDTPQRRQFITGNTIATGPWTEHYDTYLTLTRNDTIIGTALNAPISSTQGMGVAGYINGAISYPILEQAYNSVVYGTESADLLVTTNKGLSLIKTSFHAQQRYEGTTADFGFQGVKFKGATIFQDRYAPGADLVSAAEANKLGRGTSGSAELVGETLWILNTKYIRFYVSTDPLFGVWLHWLPASAGQLDGCGSLQVLRQLHRTGTETYAVSVWYHCLSR